MNYSFFILAALCMATLTGCKKKDLPAPDPLNAQNTALAQPSVNIANLKAPCESDLKKNQIITDTSSSNGTIYFTPSVSEYNGDIKILCDDYSQHLSVTVTIPDKGLFIGKIKYSVFDGAGAYDSKALLSQRIGSYYYSVTYPGYEGDIYAEYTKTEIILSFCDVKVKDNYSNTFITKGKIIIPNNY